MESNEIIDRLPLHLKDLIIDQPYNEYTARDHAVWRYVMQQNLHFLPKVAHPSYIDGLKKTGIGIDNIPHMYGMNRILKEIGWAAVSVDGFIPPAAFMEFQAHNVLVIAADIRPIDQIGYTPAPDIIHEAAGHAPIIADKDYSAYLKRFGEVGAKAFRSEKDIKVYDAVRHLSILKADPTTLKKEIEKAEMELTSTISIDSPPSEMEQIRNLHWWTVEYGLVGDLSKPKIYGAGLLSSIAESFSCLKSEIKKIPYSIKAANTGFDITKPQPQLFVTPDFTQLTDVLEEFADNMALRKGGLEGFKKAINSKSIATCEFDNGVQVSGQFSEFIDDKGTLVFIKTKGPTALSIENQQIRQHGKRQHSEGFSMPIGKIKGLENIENPAKEHFAELAAPSGKIKLEFLSGLRLEGIPLQFYSSKGKLLIITFENCLIRYKDSVLFTPEYGVFDLVLGNKIISAYPGPADAERFDWHFRKITEKTHKINYDDKAVKLHDIYNQVKAMRVDCFVGGNIEEIWTTLVNEYPEEWLIYLELLEVIRLTKNEAMYNKVFDHLWELKKDPKYKKLIEDGMEVINV